MENLIVGIFLLAAIAILVVFSWAAGRVLRKATDPKYWMRTAKDWGDYWDEIHGRKS